jgi:predicted transposase/invertase (TIGR01784 family)
MPLGIKPTVDFAFKRSLGTPENRVALKGLLNAILKLDQPIEGVEILNPFSFQEFAESKHVVLDVRCQDAAGQLFNVEMQISVYAGLLERLVYYCCSMYVDQLQRGQHYANLSPTLSICLLDNRLFPDTAQAHHCFELRDLPSGRRLAKGIEVHTLELPKYNVDEAAVRTASKLEQWAFFLRRAHLYDGDQLRRLLPGPEFEPAIVALETIAAKSEDKAMYDQREKAQRDYEWMLAGAHEEGLEKGREEGLERGIEKGRQEGKLAGRIQALQEVLGDPVTADEELLLQDSVAA